MGTEVDNQVAAPAATRTPNWHRAKQNRSSKSADGRVATAAVAGSGKKTCLRKNKRTHLTPTGLLMEGDFTQYVWFRFQNSAVQLCAQARLCLNSMLRSGGPPACESEKPN